MRKVSYKNLIYSFVFTIIISIMFFSILWGLPSGQYNLIVILSFMVNGIIMIFGLLQTNKMGYSLKDVLYLFLFLFMFFSPLVQYLRGHFPWWDTYLISDQIIFYTNILIFIFMMIYSSIYKFNFQSVRKTSKFKVISNIENKINVFFVLSLVASIFIISVTGFANLFARSTNIIDIDSSSMVLIIQNTLRAIPVIYVALNILYYRKSRKVYKIVPFLIGLVLMILVNFPTGTARFWTAVVYLGILLLLINKFNNPHLFKIFIFIGLFVIFPLINIFRRNTFADLVNLTINIPNPSDGFLSGDYDSFSMLARTIIFTDSNGFKNGFQVLGNLLFFIPRIFWTNKPIGSGATIAISFGWPFTNVSMPYIGEGYLNFGILGVIIFAIILALITSWADKTIQNNIDSKNIRVLEVGYPFSIGFLFFISRGDFLSSFSYFIGFMIPIFILLFFRKKNSI